MSFSILFGCFMIADAICFVSGFRSYLFKAKTDEEKEVLRKIINSP